MKNIADIITGSRIVFSIALLFITPFSPMFYVLYAAAGLTEMIDGTVARQTNTVSAFGAKHDAIAKFIFVAACLMKLLPLTLSFIELKYSAIVVCVAATFAAIQEGHYIRVGREKQ